MTKNKILITGGAGFIGFHLCRRLITHGFEVIAIDNLNDYYDVRIKHDRLKLLEGAENFRFIKLDISDIAAMERLFAGEKFDYVVNLAAQAGVRYSIKNPRAYIDSNILGFANVLEGCRHNKVKHLIFASSSSVYGANRHIPFSVHHNVDHPVSLYAATKKSNELLAHTYCSLYGLPCTGLRFFTVYGPWGRPDMALFLFIKAILEDRPIDVFNYGDMRRDFTYIDDIVEGVFRLIERIPAPNPEWDAQNPDPSSSYAPYKLYNIGNNNPVGLLKFIEIIEDTLGRKAEKNLLPMQPGDVAETYADIEKLTRDTGFTPSTPLDAGVEQFVAWYKEYYKIP
ncbi:NAD-dependent epimerase [Candidatus Magnetominusculus xianensis]|uniref:Capsular biosynthesis protein CpsI n=1 Tax=Candidatus Magnetominusculus xianensis TaxID=1748249 RepID=A0ABR5SEX4_9BACT|nr:NAD-dependent epimerase [Candidatus Magnetominusculus xianensis]KWT82963.1 capsular biosynthesis protein CpsI [Candidatus Magnetominusculus xianensis]MBF0403042.1 NAD-dependent epimerase [Nitrospirota bacterium]